MLNLKSVSEKWAAIYGPSEETQRLLSDVSPEEELSTREAASQKSPATEDKLDVAMRAGLLTRGVLRTGGASLELAGIVAYAPVLAPLVATPRGKRALNVFVFDGVVGGYRDCKRAISTNPSAKTNEGKEMRDSIDSHLQREKEALSYEKLPDNVF